MEAHSTYNCIVIDDEFLARKLLTEYISKVPQLRLIASLDSAVDALNLLNKEPIDILFIDIEMSDISGIDFIKNFSSRKRPIVIFVTAYPQYAAQGFEVDAMEYLIKPTTFPRFLKAVDKSINYLEMKNKIQKLGNQINPVNGGSAFSAEQLMDYMIVRTDRKMIKLKFDEIYFIEGAMEYVHFQTKDRRITGLYSLKGLEEELPGQFFMRIHKSYIVALNKIQEIEGNQVKVGLWKIYVSKSNRSRLLKRFTGEERKDPE